MTARRIALVATATVLLSGTTALAVIPESDVIRPGKGAAGVRLDMTEAQVVKILGTPSKRAVAKTELGTYVNLTYPGMVVRRWKGTNGRVVNIDVTSRRIRTWYDVGVGSTLAKLRNDFPKVTCETRRICTLGRFLPGQVVTTFRFGPRRTITSVSIGRVID